MAGFLYVKNSPFIYYLYLLFPVLFWTLALSEIHIFIYIIKTYLTFDTLCLAILYLLVLEMIVVSYFFRGILGIGFICFSFVFSLKDNNENFRLLLLWRISCFCSAVFMFLPVELEENMLLHNLGGLFSCVIGVFELKKIWTRPQTKTVFNVLATQIVMLILSIILVNTTVYSLRKQQGIPFFNQILSWLLLAISIGFPLYKVRNIEVEYRLAVIYLTFAPTMTFLGITYEHLYYCFFSVTLFLWISLEKQIIAREASLNYRMLRMSDIRFALIFLFLIHAAFFGTGNIGSVASFSISSVYRLITVFSPYIMACLLVFKLVTPFFILSACLGLISQALNVPPFSIFLIVMSIVDVITLNFFFLVRDEGSWLEIGLGISHFIICGVFEVVIILFYALSSWLLQEKKIKKAVYRE
jgi:phosphatidylinositol glycan class N